MSDWNAVSTQLASECPAEFYRNATVSILSKVEALGPLSGPGDEFRRVYRFLHYNEPHRVEAVADELLARLERRTVEKPAKHNAWSYVVGAFDQWILRARIFYLAAGVIEGTLRARLNARLNDVYGSDWFNKDVVPSSIKILNERETALARIVEVSALIGKAGPNVDAAKTLLQVQAALLPPVSRITDGAAYLETLTFAALRSFFDTKRLWGTQAKLGEIFGTPGNRPLRNDVVAQLEILRGLRNDVAHYRPKAASSFQPGLFAASKLAGWLGVDLQHVYGSIDTRMTTELSLLIDGAQPVGGADTKCIRDACTIGEPFDLFLGKAPLSASEINVADSPRACLYHRVVQRAAQHRPEVQ